MGSEVAYGVESSKTALKGPKLLGMVLLQFCLKLGLSSYKNASKM